MNPENAALCQSLLQQAAFLNACGVECLAVHNPGGAYHKFGAAIQTMTQLTNALGNLPDTEGMLMVEVEATEAWPSSKPVPKLEDTGSFVYSHPLLFAAPRAPSQGNIATCVAVLLFNTALTCHQSDMTGKALMFYQQVISAIETGPQHQEVHHILHVLARNNCTQALHAMGQWELADQGMEDLRGLVLRLQSGEDQAPPPLLMTNCNVFEELLLNILLAGNRVVAAAA